eukprot:gene12133-16244_t
MSSSLELVILLYYRYQGMNQCGFHQLPLLIGGVITEPLESLGDSITTALLVTWSKEPGDPIKEDDVIAVVETDKVTMDIRAKKAGVFIQALASVQSEIAVGSPLYKMDTSATTAPINAEATVLNIAPPPKVITTESPVEKLQKQDSLPQVTVPVPVMGESITSGVLASWSVKAGDFVKADQVLANIETDKVNVEVRSPQNGILFKTFASEGEEVTVGNPLFILSPSIAPISPATVKEMSTKSNAVSFDKSTATVKPSPNVESVKSVPVKIEASVKNNPSEKKSDAPSLSISDRAETRVKMTRMRQRIAQRLKEAQNTAAMLTTFQEVDMGNLIDLRNKHKDEFEKIHGVKLGFMSAFVRASTLALAEIPAVNAVIDDATNEIVYRHYVDVSVAVASPNGLVVPVLRNTEKMNFADIEKSIGFYGKKAKDGALALEDMVGGTFTISNGGVFGSLFGTPIINPPQSAILGMHATKMRPVVINGKIEARPMMYLALTYDHRMIDGREAVTFLKSVASKIEDPARLLLTL